MTVESRKRVLEAFDALCAVQGTDETGCDECGGRVGCRSSCSVGQAVVLLARAVPSFPKRPEWLAQAAAT